MKVTEWLQKHTAKYCQLLIDEEIETILNKVIQHPQQIDYYVINHEQQVVGYIPLNKLANYVFAEHQPAQTRRQIFERIASGNAEELMTRHFSFCYEDEELDDITHRFIENNLKLIPVLDQDKKLISYIDIFPLIKESHNNLL